MMNRDAIFDVWAPQDAVWSPWVKPVLFACISEAPGTGVTPAPAWDASWAPAAGESVAIVLDLPGAEGVLAGLALARLGYRPVPLYNAVPVPGSPTAAVREGEAVIDMTGIIVALVEHTERLRSLHLNPKAPPAFLLDSRRRGMGSHDPQSRFDNRSVTFTTDFPSGNTLLSQGVRRVVLVQPTGNAPQPDVALPLRRWQEAGLQIELKRLDREGPGIPTTLPKVFWLNHIFQRMFMAFGLRRNPSGGFGDWPPKPSSG